MKFKSTMEPDLIAVGKIFITPMGELEIIEIESDTIIYINKQIPGLEYRALRIHFLDIAFDLDSSSLTIKNKVDELPSWTPTFKQEDNQLKTIILT